MRFTSIAALASFFAVVVASPAPSSQASGVVFVPPVLIPLAGTVWTVGEKQTVTWDASKAPADFTKPGTIRLRKNGLTTPVVLGNGFDILKGKVEVTVPNVIDGSDYQIVLFGDGGNFSPKFTITGSGVSA